MVDIASCDAVTGTDPSLVEPDYLSAFDLKRTAIQKAVVKMCERNRRSSFTITSDDFTEAASSCGNVIAGTKMGWKTPQFEYVNGYKIVEIDGPAFQVYDGDRRLGDDFPYYGEAAAYAKSMPKRDGKRN